ncbi:family 10 glycosylhydrolase [Okeania sp.]|uniref:glycoside hydrolase family 10 protein n=1 Tax=Okeania sp. TaxID=3100323 RepID=UPI002B4AF29C|nr:family 10 glycosylhydrolase [Okeania sp.]MEB3342873.1 family 10 glycosylhydrolase [Okeania sp.]
MKLRGIWLTNVDSQVFHSREKIIEAMGFLIETGFNVVFPVVWNRGFTLYPSQLMATTFGREINPVYEGRDPLGEVITAAKGVGLKVIPWFEYGFVSAYKQNGGFLLSKKPEWRATDRKGSLLVKNGFAWMNALDEEVQNFLLALVLEVVKNYDVDGIQGDDRMPAFPSEGGYDGKTIARYRQQFSCHPPQNHKHQKWLQWRADILTNFLARLYREVKAVKPNVLVSMTPSFYKWGFNEYLQDYPTWMQRKIVDIIHPQLYRRDFCSYKTIAQQLAKQQLTGNHLSKVFPGILIKVGSYRISEDYLLAAIAYNRFLGIQGEVLFFYEGLRENDDALAKVLRKYVYFK